VFSWVSIGVYRFVIVMLYRLLFVLFVFRCVTSLGYSSGYFSHLRVKLRLVWAAVSDTGRQVSYQQKCNCKETSELTKEFVPRAD
jgi:hypothetical protein